MTSHTPNRTRLARAVAIVVAASVLAVAAPGADHADAAPKGATATHVAADRPGMLLFDDGIARVMACASYVPTGYGWLWNIVVTVSKPAGWNPAAVHGAVHYVRPDIQHGITFYGPYTSWWGDVVTAFDMWAGSGQDAIEVNVDVSYNRHGPATAWVGLLPPC
jgi:hypothetical protein